MGLKTTKGYGVFTSYATPLPPPSPRLSTPQSSQVTSSSSPPLSTLQSPSRVDYLRTGKGLFKNYVNSETSTPLPPSPSPPHPPSPTGQVRAGTGESEQGGISSKEMGLIAIDREVGVVHCVHIT